MDPLYLIPPALAALLFYRFSGARRKKLRRKRALLWRQYQRERNAARKLALLGELRAVGLVKESKRALRRREAVSQGQEARSAGQTLHANPYRLRRWGRGRLWRQGWFAVERNIRWIERHRSA